VKLSIVIPVYNERGTIQELLGRVRAVSIDQEKEIVAVDDCSHDGTRDLLAQEAGNGDLKLVFHPVNMGKGAAVRSGLAQTSGDIVLIQDADLEYDPADYPSLLRPILGQQAKVVYGSRFLGQRKDMLLWHSLGNSFLTLAANLLYGSSLTDMETCYKVFTREVADRIRLRSPRWGFDPEITARILKLGYRIHEVPISYRGREFTEGKKINWRDGLVVLWTLLKCRFTD